VARLREERLEIMLLRSRYIKAHPQRIRTYLVLFALALAAPLLALAAFALNRMANVEAAQIEARVAQEAQELAADIDRELYRALVTLETLATSSELKRGDLRAFHAQALLALKRTRAAIVLVDRSFQQLVGTLKDYGAELPRTADPQTAQRVIDTHQPQVSNLFAGSVSGRPVFNVEVPVLDPADTVRYVLIMSFQALHMADVLRSAKLEAPWITGITDNNGIILARSERHEEFVGKPLPAELLAQSRAAGGVFRAINVAGDPILRATARSELAGWLVSATVPTSHLDAPRRRSQAFAAILLCTAVTLGGSLAYMFGRLIAHPLDQAAQAAAAVGRDEPVAVSRSGLSEADVLIETLSNASSELKRRREHADFLMRELAHRAKNQLAVVKGMALQTARQSKGLEDFMGPFGRRLQGLAQSQDVLIRQNWQGAPLAELARAQLELFAAASRTELTGPDLFLDATAVQNIGFALHELATNAAKHGALSGPEGRLQIAWSGPSAGRIALDWIEDGGPAVQPPSRTGFGHQVIMQLVPKALQGTASLEFTGGGMHWHLEFPDAHVLNIQPAAPT
jgi:two-component sensor histidine kinase